MADAIGLPVDQGGLRERNVPSTKPKETQTPVSSLTDKVQSEEARKPDAKKTFGRTPDGTSKSFERAVLGDDGSILTDCPNSLHRPVHP